MSIFKKLNEARAKFHQIKLKKTGNNKFSGYDYFELGDFLIPALQVFNEVGLCAVISFDKDLAAMRIFDVDAPQLQPPFVITSPMGSAALKGCHEVQNIGAVETYQRRYLWMAALEIVEHDALDAVTGKGKEPEQFKGVVAEVVSQTEGALTEKRKSEIEEAALTILGMFQAGKVVSMRKVAAMFTDPDERVFLEYQLRNEPKIRSLLKARDAVEA